VAENTTGKPQTIGMHRNISDQKSLKRRNDFMTRELERQNKQDKKEYKQNKNGHLQHRSVRSPQERNREEVRYTQTDGNTIVTNHSFLTMPLSEETQNENEAKKKNYVDYQEQKEEKNKGPARARVEGRGVEDVAVFQLMDQIPPPPPFDEKQWNTSVENIQKERQMTYEKCLKRGKEKSKELEAKLLPIGVHEEELSKRWAKYEHGSNLEPEYTKEGATSQTITPAGGKYYNEVISESGEMKAHLNVKGLIEKQEPDMSPSDVLYKQFRDAGGTKLKRLSRMNVASGTGATVISYLDETKYKGLREEDIMIEPGTEEYFALMGIENCTSVFYLIHQRGKELGITGVRDLVLKANRKILEINFLTE
jgi:hypothetical protein